MRQRRDGSGLYVLAAAMCDESDADDLRASVSPLARGKRRFHWRDEEPVDRAKAVALVGELDALHVVVVGIGLDNSRQERGRRQCMTRTLWELDRCGVGRVWFDARRPNQNRHDRAMVQALRSRRFIGSDLRVDFAHPDDEPLLWLPDIVAGATSAAFGEGDLRYLTQLDNVLSDLIAIDLT
jgi:hypothetical protein